MTGQTYSVLSDRLRWKRGTTLTATDLAGCNIAALVEGGHLRLAGRSSAKQTDNDAANEPQE